MDAEVITSPDEVMRRLGAGRLELYRGDKDTRWFITYGGGEVHPETVSALLASGKIRPAYAHVPDNLYTSGRTIDMERTLEARRHRKGTRLVFEDERA